MRMDEGSSIQLSGQLGGSQNMAVGTNKQNEENLSQPQYSMPGTLHFLQTEWTRFEMARSQWEVERSELEAKIAFLQGERKGQENLKQDLVRRIKMLEFALKQERAKLHKLKYGTDLNQGDVKLPAVVNDKNKDDETSTEKMNAINSNATWRQGRQLLRQYLKEIGYADTIIDVRSSRVRQLLGLQASDSENNHLVNGSSSHSDENQGKKLGLTENVMLDSESSVMATFDFLATENIVEDEEDSISDEEDEASEKALSKIGNESMAGLEADQDTEEALAEFDFLVSESNEGAGEACSQGDGTDWEKKDVSPNEDWSGGVNQQLITRLKEQYRKDRPGGRRSSGGTMGSGGSNEDESIEALALGLGDLAGLTVHNDADPLAYDVTPATDVVRKTWNAKYTLRSHFDCVRALAFHPVEPVLITAAEDHTLKLWNLQKTVSAKKSSSLDVEPVYTFRGHHGPVLCLAMSPTGEVCFSGGRDSTIRAWQIPNSDADIDPYDSFDPSVLSETLTGHTDAVWGLSLHSHKMHLLSCSADGSVKLWSPGTKQPLLNSFTFPKDLGQPTSIDFVRCEPSQIITSFSTSGCTILNVETGQQLVSFDSFSDQPGSQINRVISHPTLPLTIAAHEDRQIRFFDNNTGKVVHSMVAHLDAVTSLAVDPNGLYLLSGSHDCSIRLWNLDSKTCVQEITSHRKKFEESIFDVAFHPSKPYIASAGADALAKVFV